jgi:beta-lactam-binding protein with PASTA domain
MVNFFRFLFSKIFVINLLIALLLLCGGVYATLNYLDDFTLHGQTQKVPKLKGEFWQDVDSLLANGEFSAVVADSVYLKDVEGGKVIEQDPGEAYEVKHGRKIYLTVSAYAPPQISMPDLEDMSLRQATTLLETFGLEVGELIYKPDVCANCILEQSYNGEDIHEGMSIPKGATIDLVLGQGLSSQMTDVPYLIEFTADLAQELLKSKYLNVGSLNYDESVETTEDSANALVYRQIPFYTEKPAIPMGSSVELFLTVDTNRITHSVNPTDSL